MDLLLAASWLYLVVRLTRKKKERTVYADVPPLEKPLQLPLYTTFNDLDLGLGSKSPQKEEVFCLFSGTVLS